MSAIEKILDRLDDVRQIGPDKWLARCPAHDSASGQSLKVTACNDGTILLHDFGGCDALAVLEAVSLSWGDLFPTRPEGRPGTKPRHPPA